MHKVTQKRFFELITSQVPLYAEVGNPINTYKELIHYRFKEVIYSAFPRFLELISEDIIDTLIVDFIKSRPQTPFIWKMPDEFRLFLLKSDLAQKYPFMEDMLWFEWIEIELFMGNYTPRVAEDFSWKERYMLSPSAVIRELYFPVHYEQEYAQGGIYPLLMFYNFETHDVHFQEITPFLQQFLMSLKKRNIQTYLKEICKTYELDIKEVKELLEETLQSFVHANILIKEPS